MKKAIREFEIALGPQHICQDPQLLSSYETATFATSQRVTAVLFPLSCAHVRQCMQIAQRHGVALYPISRGKNWGNGCAVPLQTDCVVLDLSHMRRILDYDDKLGTVRVEPGVSQRQLMDFLAAEGSPFTLMPTGSTWDASLVGNALERGDSLGLCGDRALNAHELEIVLPDGELVTQFPVGPNIEGLFFQSNLGVVTKMTLSLEPRPSSVFQLNCVLEDLQQLGSAVECIRELMLRRQLHAVSCWNDIKALSKCMRYPFELAGDKTPIPDALRQHFRDIHGLGAWNLSCHLYAYGDEAELKQRAERIQKQLETCLINVSVTQTPYEAQEHVETLYWRKPTEFCATGNPHVDQCGLIWVMPLVAFERGAVLEICELLESVVMAHGFEASLALNAVDGRCFRMSLAIIYDRGVLGEDARAMSCHHEALKSCVGRGFYPYRAGLQSKEVYLAQSELVKRIKKLLDPKNLLAPGKS